LWRFPPERAANHDKHRPNEPREALQQCPRAAGSDPPDLSASKHRGGGASRRRCGQHLQSRLAATTRSQNGYALSPASLAFAAPPSDKPEGPVAVEIPRVDGAVPDPRVHLNLRYRSSPEPIGERLAKHVGHPQRRFANLIDTERSRSSWSRRPGREASPSDAVRMRSVIAGYQDVRRGDQAPAIIDARRRSVSRCRGDRSRRSVRPTFNRTQLQRQRLRMWRARRAASASSRTETPVHAV